WLAGAVALLLLHRAGGRPLHPPPALAALAVGAAVGAFILLGGDNPLLSPHPGGPTPIVNWLPGAYRPPVPAPPALARLLRASASPRPEDAAIANMAETGAIVLALALGSFEIHHFMNDGVMTSAPARFVEPALLVNLWLAGVIGLLLVHRANGNALYRW